LVLRIHAKSAAVTLVNRLIKTTPALFTTMSTPPCAGDDLCGERLHPGPIGDVKPVDGPFHLPTERTLPRSAPRHRRLLRPLHNPRPAAGEGFRGLLADTAAGPGHQRERTVDVDPAHHAHPSIRAAVRP
jgi:hypothetical protein